MLNFTEGMATVMVGLFIVGSTSLNYDSAPNVPVGSCGSLAGGGVVVRCDPGQLGRAQTPFIPVDLAWLNAVVMGPDPGGKATKESVDQDRGGAKPTPSTSPSPTPSPNPREEENRQKRSDNSWLQEDCDGSPSAVRTHCLMYLSFHAK